MFLLVCYDITDDKRRTKIRRVLRNFGEGVQESVFELVVDARQKAVVTRRVEALLQGEDRIRYYVLCESCIRKIEGTEGHPTGIQPSCRVF